MRNLLPASSRIALMLLGIAVLAGLGLRLALIAAWLPASAWLWPGPLLLLYGLVSDCAAWTCVLALPMALLACGEGRQPRFLGTVLTMAPACAGLVLGAAVEWYFFEEFSSRFNHIAVDYVLYPHEVANTISEGYPLWPWLCICAVAGPALAWWPARWVVGVAVAARPWRRRLGIAGCWLAAGGMGAAWLAWMPVPGGGDRRAGEIARNGVASLAGAAWSSQLDYQHFYATPARVAPADLAQARGPAGGGAPLRTPSQIVVVLEESFGSEFIGCLGGEHARSPDFDRWSQRGLLFTNLIATGNRTVRGMEGVLASLPPVPPDSVVKRSALGAMPSIASACKDAGYAPEFIYGGVSTFDHMAPWLEANGWGRIHDDGLIGGSAFPPDAFRTAWGVDDVTLLDTVLARQRAAKAAGEKVFLTALTVGNHKPFLVPPPYGDPKPLSAKHKLRYSLIGLVVLAVLALLWWKARRAVGWPALGALSLVVFAGAWIFITIKVTRSDDRLNAVAYADHAIGRYLDGLEREGLLEDSLVLIVADHGARVYGAQDLPFPSYRIPALIVGGGGALAGARIDRLCSQIDLAPTLLGLAGVPAPAGFFGQDQRGLPAAGGRALLQHNRDIALLDDQACVVLGLNKSVSCYLRDGEHLHAARPAGADWERRIEAAKAIFAETAGRIAAAMR